MITPEIYEVETDTEQEIIYRKIVKSDFSKSLNKTITQIKANKDGYVSDVLMYEFFSNQNYNKSSTNLINVGVGQGKTTFVEYAAIEYYKLGYSVIIAAPFKAIVDKYYTAINSILNNNDEILNYKSFDELHSFDTSNIQLKLNEWKSKKIIVCTTNFILRNPGELYYEQSQIKQSFLDKYFKHNSENNNKIIIFFDEIHASVKSFSRQRIFELFKFKNYIHTLYFLSATFNEESIEVSKICSYLTDNKVKVINSDRIRVEKRQSELKLLVTNQNYSLNPDVLFDIMHEKIRVSISAGNKVNILTPTRKLAETIGAVFIETYNELDINVCTSQSNNEFQPNSDINIGTIFSTGNNIDNGLFFIILPDRTIFNNNYESYGIFSNGYYSIVQSIARLRNHGEINIITPFPIKSIKDNFENVLKEIYPITSVINEDETLLSQDRLLSEAYSNITSEIKNVVGDLSTCNDLINYPTESEWILKNGDLYLLNKYLRFGKYVAPYVYWASLNNQFQNCRLTQIEVYKSELQLTTSSLRSYLEEAIFKIWYDENFQTSVLSHFWFDSEIKLLKKHLILLDKAHSIVLNGKNITIHNQILKKEILNVICSIKGSGKGNLTFFKYLRDSLKSIELKPSLRVNNSHDVSQYYEKLKEIKNYYLNLVQAKGVVNNGYKWISNQEFGSEEQIQYLERELNAFLNDIYTQDWILKMNFIKINGKFKNVPLSRNNVFNLLRETFLITSKRKNRIVDGTPQWNYKVLSENLASDSLNDIAILIFDYIDSPNNYLTEEQRMELYF